MYKLIAVVLTWVVAVLLPAALRADSVSNSAIWSDDTVPAGALELTDGRDIWNWVASNPTPVSGALAHQSNALAGLHEHFFNYANAPLDVAAGQVLFTYVYLDAANPPSEIMLSWHANGWEHRAYWGANAISYGTDGTAGRHYMGGLPVAGQWVRLEVAASEVALEGASITGMGFSLFDGRATWDASGAASPTTNQPAIAANVSATDIIWSDDAVPEGAVELTDGIAPWNWIASNPAPVSGALAHQSGLSSGLHQHFFNFAAAPLTVGAGEVLFTYINIDPANPPSEVMLSWNADGWEHRAYWGANAIPYGTDGMASRQNMGALPAAGEWVRLEVSANQVGLEGATITGMGFSLFGGRVTWDKTGKASFASVAAPTPVTPPFVAPPVITPTPPPIQPV